MAQIVTNLLVVDDSSRNLLGDSFPSSVLIRNIGENTAYLGTVNVNSSTQGVDISSAYPLHPGESCTVPAYSDTTGTYFLAANTDGGTSELRFLYQG